MYEKMVIEKMSSRSDEARRHGGKRSDIKSGGKPQECEICGELINLEVDKVRANKSKGRKRGQTEDAFHINTGPYRVVSTRKSVQPTNE